MFPAAGRKLLLPSAQLPSPNPGATQNPQVIVKLPSELTAGFLLVAGMSRVSAHSPRYRWERPHKA